MLVAKSTEYASRPRIESIALPKQKAATSPRTSRRSLNKVAEHGVQLLLSTVSDNVLVGVYGRDRRVDGFKRSIRTSHRPDSARCERFILEGDPDKPPVRRLGVGLARKLSRDLECQRR